AFRRQANACNRASAPSAELRASVATGPGGNMQPRLRLFGVLVVTLMLLAPPLAAQQSTVTGRVTDGSSGEPIAAVQVLIAGLRIGSLSQQDGRYILQNVPVGTHELSAQRIGYRTVTAQITVTA